MPFDDFIGSNGIQDFVDNPNVLKIEYITDDVLYRQDKINEITEKVFRGVYLHNFSENLLVLGSPGTGKTLTIKHMLDEFEQKNDKESIKTMYINCQRANTQSKFFRTLLDKLDQPSTRGMSIAHYSDKAFKTISDQNLSIILVLDEIDALDRQANKDHLNDVLYKLTRPSEVYDDYNSSLSIIGISNDLQIKDSMSDSVTSSFGNQKVNFGNYTRTEINNILLDRQAKAFKTDILDTKQMKQISGEVHDYFGGDIRMGIRILKVFTKKLHKDPEDLDQSEIKTIIDDAIREVKTSEIANHLQEMSDHALLVTKAFTNAIKDDQLQFQEIKKRYEKICKALKEEIAEGKKHSQFVRRRLKDLHDNNLVYKHVDYDKQHHPSIYKPLVDGELLDNVVNRQLQEKGLQRPLAMAQSQKQQT